MDFTLTDGQKKLVSAFRTFGADTFTPERVAKWCRDQGLPDTVMKEFVDLYYETAEPDIAPDLAHSLLSQVLIVEELSRCAGTTLPFQNDLFNLQIMSGFAGAAEAASIAEDYRADGRLMFALAISEPEAGSDNQGMECLATRTGDGKVHINGVKTWVTQGEHVDGFIVVCKDEDPSRENKNMSLWLVPSDTPGVSTAALTKLGQQTVPFVDVFFDDVVLTEANRLGEAGQGWLLLMKNFEFERCLVVAQGLGLAEAALDDAIDYALDRIAFGKPIADNPRVQDLITESKRTILYTRMMLYLCLWMLDQGMSCNAEVAMLKSESTKTCLKVADNAIEIFGGLGYTEEVRVGRIWKDLRGNALAGGTCEVMDYIAGRAIVNKYRARKK